MIAKWDASRGFEPVRFQRAFKPGHHWTVAYVIAGEVKAHDGDFRTRADAAAYAMHLALVGF